ncbi:MAG TPA: IPT/TIG domain-containing protein [Chryseolinea sp.]
MKKLFCYRFPSLLLAAILVFSTCQKEEDKPVILKVSPDSGRAGDAVVISGLLLGHATRVTFGTTEGKMIAAESKAVSTQVPDGLPLGKVSLTVETNGGISNALEFSVIPSIPEITAIAPAKGSPGMRVTLTGRYFSNVNEVNFGDQKITAFDASSDTGLAFKIPANSTLGEKDVTVTTPGGISKKMKFTVVSPPAITSFSPTAGLAGITIHISGTNLNGITAIHFQDAAAVFEVKSATLVDAVVPAEAATGKLKVVGEGGEALSDTDFVVEGAPVVSAFKPVSGTITTEVTIHGGNFLPNSKVKFGSIYASVMFVSETQLKATVPAGAISAPVVVETDAGTGKSDKDFLVIPAPSVDSFTPTKGVAGISRITIGGANFTDISSVKFNGAEAGQANIAIKSLTSLDVKVPAKATTGTVEITNPSGTGISTAVFNIVDPSSALVFTPASAPANAWITITGFGFDNTTVVKFNGTPVVAAGVKVDSETSIRAQVPTNSTTGNITVTTGDLTLGSSQDFVVLQPPSISSFSPKSGPVGTQIVINGSNFDDATVNFNGIAITKDLKITFNTISFYVPTGATTGPITITTVAGSAQTGPFAVVPPPTITSFSPTFGAVGSTITIYGSSLDQTSSVQFSGIEVGSSNFQAYPTSIVAKIPVGAITGKISVTTPAGSYTTSNDFMVAPIVNTFSPASGPTGTPVNITGLNFDNITHVLFNGLSAVFTRKSTTTIEATVPAGASTGPITVINNAGAGSSNADFSITPTLSSISPTSGKAGDPVTITGSGFTRVNSVTFYNGVAATYSIVSDTKITTTVPASSVTGTVAVSNTVGTANATFNVTTPALVFLNPGYGKAGGSFSLYGNNLGQITKITIGGVNASFTKKSTYLLVTVPPATSGQKSVVAFWSGGSSNSLTFTVTY